ncbi:MAG: hypothetical protein AB7O50_15020 [Pseudolabrys sp.]
MDADKTLQLYCDRVLKKKVSPNGFECERIASAVAFYLISYEIHLGLHSSVPTNWPNSPKVDTSNRDTATVERIRQIALKHQYDDAHRSISKLSHDAIIAAFYEGKALRTVGAKAGQKPDTDSNASINNEVARAYIRAGGDQLARHYQIMRNRK